VKLRGLYAITPEAAESAALLAMLQDALEGGAALLQYRRGKRDVLEAKEVVRLARRHGVPVIVQTMTRTMPGWNHWNATHMITIFAFDFRHNDPSKDTVTYAETPSPLAGYRGPDFQTITVQALWTAIEILRDVAA